MIQIRLRSLGEAALTTAPRLIGIVSIKLVVVERLPDSAVHGIYVVEEEGAISWSVSERRRSRGSRGGVSQSMVSGIQSKYAVRVLIHQEEV
jgi:hypothetical protein